MGERLVAEDRPQVLYPLSIQDSREYRKMNHNYGNVKTMNPQNSLITRYVCCYARIENIYTNRILNRVISGRSPNTVKDSNTF